jgi:hypothetical protein
VPNEKSFNTMLCCTYESFWIITLIQHYNIYTLAYHFERIEDGGIPLNMKAKLLHTITNEVGVQENVQLALASYL